MSLTVGDLKELFTKTKAPDSMIVTYERIEDVYFSEHKWVSEPVFDSAMPEHPDEYIQGEIAFIQDNKLRITAHW